eukprot:260845-Amphidinium_carterae.1
MREWQRRAVVQSAGAEVSMPPAAGIVSHGRMAQISFADGDVDMPPAVEAASSSLHAASAVIPEPTPQVRLVKMDPMRPLICGCALVLALTSWHMPMILFWYYIQRLPRQRGNCGRLSWLVITSRCRRTRQWSSIPQVRVRWMGSSLRLSLPNPNAQGWCCVDCRFGAKNPEKRTARLFPLVLQNLLRSIWNLML